MSIYTDEIDFFKLVSLYIEVNRLLAIFVISI